VAEVIQIIPAILTNSENELQEMLTRCEDATQRVQIDILDGVFAGNTTIDPTALENTNTKMSIDYHLMVKEPIEWIEKCITGKGDRIIGQIEMMWSQKLFVEEVKARGLQVGLALDLDTAVEKLDPETLYAVDVILVMSVKAGFGGQEFDQRVVEKIRELDHIRARDELSFKICDDGGMTLENVDDVHITGVDEVAVGKRIFEGDIKTNIQSFQNAAHTLQ
jgi:ribulose-phosphate 3-epimerase